MRWLAILCLLAVSACGPDEQEAAPVPVPGETPAATDDGPPAKPLAPPGTRERGGHDVIEILVSHDLRDEAVVKEVLGKLEEYRAKYEGLPAEIEALTAAARLLTDLRRHEEAARHWLAASELVEGDEKTFLALSAARSFADASLHDEAIALLEKLVASHPKGPSARDIELVLARAYLEGRRPEPGFEIFREFIGRAGDNARGWHARFELAQALVIEGRDDEARALCQPLWDEHALSPIGQSAGVVLAEVAIRAGRIEEARPILERILRIGEGSIAVTAKMILDGFARRGEPAPELAGTCVGGSELTAEDLAGRPTVVLFWDPSNTYSILLMQRWSVDAERVHPGRYNLVGVPFSHDEETILDALRINAIHAPQRRAGPDTAEEWGIRSIPWTWILDADGKLFSCGWPLGRVVGLPEGK